MNNIIRHTSGTLAAAIIVCFSIVMPPSLAAQVSVAALAPSSVELNWLAPGDDGTLGDANMYSVRYSTDSATLVSWDGATEAPSGTPLPAGTEESLTIEGLDPATHYYIGIKSCDEAHNWSEMSNIVAVTTEGTSMQLASVAVSDISADHIRIDWNTTQPATQQVYFGYTSQLGFSTDLDPTLRATHSVVVDSLPAAAQIYFRVASRDSLGTEVLSSFYQITTDSAGLPPEAISNLVATTGTSNGEIDLVWTAPTDDGVSGAVAYYVIQLSASPFGETDTAGITTWPLPPTPLPYGQRQSFTLTFLELGELYYVAIRSVDFDGNISSLSNLDSAVSKFSIIADVDDDTDGLPDTYALSQNYPNPFNPSTMIGYGLPEPAYVLLQLFNIKGQVVRTLVDERQLPGYHEVEWDGRTSAGSVAATGVYFYRITAGEFAESKKMMLVK